MEEILPGIFHWTAFHEGIRQPVSSHYVVGSATLIDPMLLDDGLEWFRERKPPQRILLTNRHHYRHSDQFAEAFGCPVACHESGLHEFEGGPDVQGFAAGDELSPGITALEVGAICPDDSALHISAGDGCLGFADGLIRSRDGSLAFVPDHYMGDDPEGVKRGLRQSLRRLLDEDFDNLLFAHGLPLVGGGKAALTEFVEQGPD
jgi:glyoxylase-like metal-dependent hydrolase (beta-lactamase superfamily II)